MNFVPLSDRVLVKRDTAEDKIGSLLIPDSAQEKPSRGVVINVGPGKVADNGERLTMNVAVGDLVLFGRHSGTEVTLEGDKFVVMTENDIIGVFQ